MIVVTVIVIMINTPKHMCIHIYIYIHTHTFIHTWPPVTSTAQQPGSQPDSPAESRCREGLRVRLLRGRVRPHCRALCSPLVLPQSAMATGCARGDQTCDFRDFVNFPSELCRHRSGTFTPFTQVARLVPPEYVPYNRYVFVWLQLLFSNHGMQLQWQSGQWRAIKG